ncbi:acetyltransferase [Aestuariibaculum lutulentum]|uniref:Acetyltransferase n=1 Tax=Aestuariibaculum lutulentum TaxID=2920935 RepID=A0ABS9RE74_9FLAO|nr:acetyltransferase [Aestuariibaculum lutulentum]MCH4551252.1 acetyltransferase [Aestuariibaculum lutulentum]
MIIVGAKGFAKEILQIVSVDMGITDEHIVFFDNVSSDLPDKVYDRFQILKSFEALEQYKKQTADISFVLGLGNPKFREKLFNVFIERECQPVSVFSKHTDIGSFDVEIGEGTSVMSGSIITNSISIGKGCLINLNTTIGHDSTIGDFVEVSPNVNISGRCCVGKGSIIGTNAILLPGIHVGMNVVIGAGSVITKNVPDNCTVVGVPGRIISKD